MDIRIGTAVKRLRTEKGITQEELANYIGISFQAISKWENGVTAPDISLLPKLAIFFGVTIDDLFSINDTDHFERIDKMLQDEYIISDDNFIYADRYLKGITAEDPDDAGAMKRLSRLYQHRSNRDLLSMGDHAEKGLSVSPFDRELHGLYVQTREMRREPERLISFYETFTVKYPNNLSAVEILINAYIKNRYFDKAIKLINKTGGLPKLKLFAGDIELQMGMQDKAVMIWEESANENPPDAIILYETAERFKRIGSYEKAIKYYMMSYDACPPPKTLDSLYSLAFLYDRLGLLKEAVEMWEKILAGLKIDYSITDGETADWPRREIQKLKAKM